MTEQAKTTRGSIGEAKDTIIAGSVIGASFISDYSCSRPYSMLWRSLDGLGLSTRESSQLLALIGESRMSVEIYPKVLDLDMGARRKLVLAVLADHADEDGLCWPSQTLIGRRASIPVRKLRDHLRVLEREGWLQTSVNGGPKEVNCYRLNVAKIAEAAGLRRQQAIEERKSKRAKFSDVAFVTPDFADIPPDLLDIPPDLLSTNPGPQGPTEPSRKRKGNAMESPGHSPDMQKTISYSEPTDTAKVQAKERLRGWAEFEDSDPGFSDPQRIRLQKALEDACAVLLQSELLLELWTWDFLDDKGKTRWKDRIEHPYGTVETPERI